ncbi:DUF6790 family protein [Roseibium sp. Sym1]|uniref:DUF6790 family protein n=1 Tax=Roseibium sp. Sym1 TaxID=3016006 RepID=UPI0022B44952|nr:DUF6790 family protein [Roseibium sp. Sym1]
MIADVIKLVLSNPSLVLLVLGGVVALGILVSRSKPLPKGAAMETVLSQFILFSIGIGYLYNFVIHVFFADMAAKFIGWANSPFQLEVGFASLGFAVVGFLAFSGSRGLRIASVVGPSVFLLGAAGGHVYQMVAAHNFAPGNAGVVFWTDIFIPVIGFTLLWLTRASTRPSPAGPAR